MTAYNAMPYIREAVENILDQSLREFSFLILNNGSTDGTRAFLEDLARRHAEKAALAAQEKGVYPKLKIIHLEENIGRTPVLNKGLALVETDLTAIMDADDLAAPERLARQAAFFQAHPEVDLLGSDVRYVDRGGAVIGQEHFPSEHTRLCERLPLYNQFAHSACMFRTAGARAAGGYCEGFPYAQDLALWVEMLKMGKKAASIPEALAGIRVHPGQASRDKALAVIRNNDNYRLAEAMLDIPGLGPAARQAARLRSAGALFSLGRRGAALAQGWQGLLEAPLLLPCNPLLWERLGKEFRSVVRSLKKLF